MKLIVTDTTLVELSWTITIAVIRKMRQFQIKENVEGLPASLGAELSLHQINYCKEPFVHSLGVSI